MLLAAASAFWVPKKGVLKMTPSTSMPCSSIIFAARMLSRPPENNAMALDFNILSD
jgi:hypothetical protein